MSLLTNYTNANTKEAYFLKANALLLNVSTLNAGNISTASIATSSLVGQFLSTIELDAEYINNSTINTLHVDLDGQILTATPTELLLNGVPVATQSSLSSIADWSLDPAISTVQMAGYDLNGAGSVSSLNVRAGNALFGNLVAFNSIFVSTATSTISTSIEWADLGNFSTLNAGTISSGQIAAPLANFSTLNAGTISSGQIAASAANFSSANISSLTANQISTPALLVSSINGSEFTSTGITVQVAGVSSLVANSISSIGAEIRNALVSTIQFKPSFDLALNMDTKALAAGLFGGLTNIGVGIGTGLGIIGTGLIGAVLSRPSGTSVNTNNYYQYATPTQLQFSTLGMPTSTFTRLVSSSGAGNQVPGQEIIISSVISSGTLCVRSLGDPVNLADPSTFTSTIQSFGEWAPVPIEVPPSTLSTIEDWAIYPAISTINFSTGVTANVQASPGSDIAITGASVKLIGGYTDANNLLLVSSISTGTILGANNNLFGLGIQGLELRTAPTGQVWISSPQTNVAGLLNTSTVGAKRIQAGEGWISSLAVSSLTVTDAISTSAINAVNVSTANLNAYDMVSYSLSSAVILGAKVDALPGPIPGIEIRTPAGGGIYLNTSQTVAAGLLNTSTLVADSVFADRGRFSTLTTRSEVVSSLSVSSINGFPFYPVASQFTSTIINSGLSTIAQPIASTSVVVSYPSYTLAQANTSIKNITNQFHESFLYLTIDGQQSASTITTLPNKVNSFSGQSISFRGGALSTGTYTCVLWGYADADGDLQVSQTDLFTLTNLV